METTTTKKQKIFQRLFYISISYMVFDLAFLSYVYLINFSSVKKKSSET